MPKLSNVALPVAVRDSSTRRDDVSTAHTMRDTRNPMAYTKPTNRSFMLEFIARLFVTNRLPARPFVHQFAVHKSRRAVLAAIVPMQSPSQKQSQSSKRNSLACTQGWRRHGTRLWELFSEH